MSMLGWSLPAGCSSTPYDEMGAYEVKVDGKWVAWDEDGNVYLQVGKTAEREDGYSYIGNFEPKTANTDAELAEFVRRYVVTH